MGETQRQKNKKNHNRVKAADRSFYPSIQKNYSKPKVEKPKASAPLF